MARAAIKNKLKRRLSGMPDAWKRNPVSTTQTHAKAKWKKSPRSNLLAPNGQIEAIYPFIQSIYIDCYYNYVCSFLSGFRSSSEKRCEEKSIKQPP